MGEATSAQASNPPKDKIYIAIIVFLAVMVLGLLIFITARAARVPAVCLTSECMATAVRVKSFLDLSADPCQDFYQFACGNFKNAGPDPAVDLYDMRSLGQASLYSLFREKLEAKISPSDSATLKKMKKFYASCINPDKKVEEFKVFLLEDDLTATSLEQHIVDLHLMGIVPLFKISLHKNSTHPVYIRVSESFDFAIELSRSPEVVEAYRTLMRKVLFYIDAENIDEVTDEIIEFEIDLQEIMKKHALKPSTSQVYLTLDEMESKFLDLEWSKLFQLFLTGANISSSVLSLSDVVDVEVETADHLSEVSGFITDRPKTTHRFLTWVMLEKLAAHIGPELAVASRDFRSAVVDYFPWHRPVRLREGCVTNVAAEFNEAAFAVTSSLLDPKDRQKMQELFESVKAQVKPQKWMNATLREEFEQMTKNVAVNLGGAPSRILDRRYLDKEFEPLVVEENDPHIVNVRRVRANQFRRTLLARLRNERSGMENPMNALEVEAYAGNEVVVMGGFLLPPFYQSNRPNYVNNAGLGLIFGHELGHVVDPQFYLETGATLPREAEDNWKCLVDQYSDFFIDDLEIFVNGTATAEDNFGDNLGLETSFMAYLEAKEGEEPKLPGLEDFTNHQMFFISTAQYFCEAHTLKGLQRFKHDEHSPGKFRVNGAVANSHHFPRIFNCPHGSPMNPWKKCLVWDLNG